MPFASLNLHPSLLKGVKELGFTRPTPIQADAIPPALEGRDVLACAMTGSGKTAAFLLPILQRLIDSQARHHPRAGPDARPASWPPRSSRTSTTSRCTRRSPPRPSTAASAWGRRSTRSAAAWTSSSPRPAGCSTTCKQPYAKLAGLEVLVLDEADRMLDMGFLPDIKRILRHIPAKRQTLFFSATMPAPIAALTREMLHDPATINLARQVGPRRRHHAGGVPGARRSSRRRCFLALLAQRRDAARRSSSPAPSTAPTASPSTWSARASRRSGSTATARRRSAPRRWPASRAASTACSWPPTSPRAASTSRSSATS